MSVKSTTLGSQSVDSLLRVHQRAEEVAGIGSWRLEIPSGTLTWSEGMYRLFGVDPSDEDVDLASITETRIHPEDRERLQQINHDVLRDGMPRPAEYRVVRPGGDTIWVDSRGEQETAPDGTVTALVGFVQDITDRKLAELTALEHIERFRYVWNNSTAAKSLTRPDGQIEVNQAFLDMLGYTREEIKAHGTWQQISHPDDVAETQRYVNAMLSGEIKSARFEKRYIRKDGGIVWADVSTSLRRKEDGTPDYFMTTILDITERKAAEQRLVRTARSLKTLSACNELLLRAENEEALLKGICDVVVIEGGYVMAWVGYRREDEACTIEPVAWSGADGGFLSEVQFSWAEGNDYPSACCIRSGEIVVTKDTTADNLDAIRDEVLSRGFRSAIALPLQDADGKSFGVLMIAAGQPAAFDSDEITLLSELAADVSFGIQTLRSGLQREYAEHELAETNSRLEALLRSLTETLGRVVEQRDPYTQGHELRVAEVATAIAEELGMSEDEIRGIEVAALVHDIGKLSVPTEILTKPGSLSEHELMLIRDHANAGHAVLSGIPFPWPVAEIVLQHHERLDGSGYPAGLKNGDISMGARIIAVADVVEAMSSHRPYRPALGLERAIQEVSVVSPEAYDPEVTEACIRLRDRGLLRL